MNYKNKFPLKSTFVLILLIIAASWLNNFLPAHGLKVWTSFDKDPGELNKLDTRLDSSMLIKFQSNVPKFQNGYHVGWSGFFYASRPDNYIFIAEIDDPFILSVDNVEVINQTLKGNAHLVKSPIHVSKGFHRLDMRFHVMKGKKLFKSWVSVKGKTPKPLYTMELYTDKISPTSYYVKKYNLVMIKILLLLLLHVLLKHIHNTSSNYFGNKRVCWLMNGLLILCIGAFLFSVYPVFFITAYFLFWFIGRLIIVPGKNDSSLFETMFLVFILFLMLTFTRGLVSSNDGSHFALVRAMVEDRSYRINPYLSYTINVDASFLGGNYYSDRPPGTALASIMFYITGELLRDYLGARISYHRFAPFLSDIPTIYTTTLLSVISGILSLLLFYGICLKLHLSKKTASVSILLLAMGTMHLKYASVLYSHSFCRMLVLLLLYLILSAKDCLENNNVPYRYLFFIGLVLGYMPLVEYIHLVMILPVTVYLLYLCWKKMKKNIAKIFAVTVLGVLCPLGFLAYYNYHCFGNIFTISYSFSLVEWVRSNRSFQGNFLEGLVGLLFHPRYKGIFFTSPYLILGVLGIIPFLRKEKAFFLLTSSMFLIMLILVSNHLVFWGGKTRDARYLFTVVPLLIIPLAYWIDKILGRKPLNLKGKILKPIFYILAVYSISYQLYFTMLFGRIRGEGPLGFVSDQFAERILDQSILAQLFPHFKVVPVTFLVISIFLLPLINRLARNPWK